MAWARLDDNFHSHPKTYLIGLDGCGLFCKAISYAAHYLTDGFVPEVWVQAQLPSTRVKRDERGILDRLLDAGMFQRVDGGYMIHGYLDLNPSRTKVEQDRADAAERMRSVRANGKPRSQSVRANTPTAFERGSASPYPRPHLELLKDPHAAVEGPEGRATETKEAA